jgi:hypothetical protein
VGEGVGDRLVQRDQDVVHHPGGDPGRGKVGQARQRRSQRLQTSIGTVSCSSLLMLVCTGTLPGPKLSPSADTCLPPSRSKCLEAGGHLERGRLERTPRGDACRLRSLCYPASAGSRALRVQVSASAKTATLQEAARRPRASPARWLDVLLLCPPSGSCRIAATSLATPTPCRPQTDDREGS